MKSESNSAGNVAGVQAGAAPSGDQQLKKLLIDSGVQEEDADLIARDDAVRQAGKKFEDGEPESCEPSHRMKIVAAYKLGEMKLVRQVAGVIINEILTRRLVRQKIDEIVRKKGSVFVLYAPHKKKQGGKAKKIGEYPDKLSAKKAELRITGARLSPSTKKRREKEIRALEKDPIARRGMKKPKKFKKALKEGLDPSQQPSIQLSDIPKKVYTTDPRLSQLVQSRDRAAKETVSGAMKAIGDHLKGKKFAVVGAISGGKTTFSVKTSDGFSLGPYEIKVSDDKVEIDSKAAKGDEVKIEASKAAEIEKTIAAVQKQLEQSNPLKDTSDAIKKMIGQLEQKHDAHLARLHESDPKKLAALKKSLDDENTANDDYLKDLKPLDVEIVRILLDKKYGLKGEQVAEHEEDEE